MKKITITLFLICFVTASAYAIIFGGTNFGWTGYPDHECRKPEKPIRPYSISNQWEVDSFNNDVDNYNMNRRTYINCIKNYLDNANNDVLRIHEKMDSALEEAKN